MSITLLTVYRSLLTVYRSLLTVYRSLLTVYRSLLTVSPPTDDFNQILHRQFTQVLP